MRRTTRDMKPNHPSVAHGAKRSKAKAAPAPRRKPGPKPGPRAALTRHQRRLKKQEETTARQSFDLFLAALREGKIHEEAMTAGNLAWPDVVRFRNKWPKMDADYRQALSMRDDFWRQQRLDVSHHRAVVGVKRSVVGRDGILGHDLVPSDQLMAMHLKRDDPDGFSERVKNEHNVAPPLVDLLMQLEGRTAQKQPEPSPEAPPKPPA